jgi:hypothetical protein
MFRSKDWFGAFIDSDGEDSSDPNFNTESLTASHNLRGSPSAAHIGEVELILSLWVVDIDHSRQHRNGIGGESIPHVQYRRFR